MTNALAQIPILVLAGGLGTRLRPAVGDRPKGLASVGDRSFLEIQIGLLRDQGARRFVLCVGHRSEQIRDTFGDGSALGVNIEYSVESEQLLGTAGAVRLAERFISPRAMVVNGDTYLDTDFDAIVVQHLERHEQESVVATLTLCQLDDASRYGTVALDPSGRFVKGFREKAPGNGASPGWLNAGAYIIERSLVDLIPHNVPWSLERDWFPQALAQGRTIAAVRRDEPFYDIGTPEDYRRFVELFETRIRPPNSRG